MIKSGYLTIILFFLVCGCSFAQGRVPAWGGGNDLEPISFGYTFQYIRSDYKIVKNADWRKPYFDTDLQRNLTDSVSSIGSRAAQGFAVGFIARLNLINHLELRTTPQLVFTDRNVQYNYNTPSQNVIRQVSTTSIDVPLGFKIKSDRLQDFRLYMLGGVKYSIAINKKPSIDNLSPLERPLQNLRNFASYEAGIGCDIYFEYFKLSPELKLSNSFGNVLLRENTAYANPINKMFLHMIMFSLHFE